MIYSNYSVWTAARAVQRNFTTTANIKRAIEQSDLPTIARSNNIKCVDQYDRLHCQWAEQLINYFDILDAPKCSYGRAAKIISIYLKTSVLLCNRASLDIPQSMTTLFRGKLTTKGYCHFSI